MVILESENYFICNIIIEQYIQIKALVETNNIELYFWLQIDNSNGQIKEYVFRSRVSNSFEKKTVQHQKFIVFENIITTEGTGS